MRNKSSRKMGVLFIAIVLFLSATIVSSGTRNNIRELEEEEETLTGNRVENEIFATLILDWNDLNNLRNYLDSDVVLYNDLDENSPGYDDWVGTASGWEPIGDDVDPFTGIFDGNGKTISGLYIDRPTEEYIGLFGYTNGAEIKDIELTGVDVTGEQRVGGLVGYNNGLISNTSASGEVEGTSGYYNGVLVGYNFDSGEVHFSHSSGTVTGTNGLGGLCGLNLGTISDSYSTADVIATGNYIGGFVGEHRGGITNAYSIGEVSGSSYVGGFVGWNSGTVENSFWDNETSGQTTSEGGTGKTTEEMKDVATFTDISTDGLDTPWDFFGDPNDDVGEEDTWHIHEMINDGYPFLLWEPSAIYDWHDLDAIRNNLDGGYILMNDLDENSAGYANYNSHAEASYEVEEDAGYSQTWDDGDTIEIRFDEGDYDSVLGVEDDEGNPIAHSVGEEITIDEDTGERYVYVFYENALIGWDPIGEFDANMPSLSFTGSFYGNGHVIKDLFIQRPSEDDVGLFGCIRESSIVENIGLIDNDVVGVFNTGGLVGNNRGTVNNSYANGNVSGYFSVGGLVGISYWNTISNSFTTGNVVGTRLLGGLVGYNMYGDISNSYSTAMVTGDQNRIGGLIGYNHGTTIKEATISNSYAAGDVIGRTYVGGFVGYSYSNATISDCYATGSVTGHGSIGGLVGLNTYYEYEDNFKAASVFNSYSTGTVSGNQEVGGLVGFNDQSIVYNSFWDTETSGTDTGIGDGDQDGATGKTTAQMNDVATFTDLSTSGLNEPWDFVDNPNDDVTDEDIWNIHESYNDGYPFLNWNPFAIYDWYDLDGIRQNLDGDYVLMNDLDVNSAGYDDLVNTCEGWEPIGDENIVFTGTFDGNGHLLKDLNIHRPSEDYIGLFGHVGGGKIHNMGIVDADVTGYDYTGTLAGRSNDGSIYEIYATGTLNGNLNVGGLVGSNAHDATISSSYVNVNVAGDDSRIGGLVGNNWFGMVINSYSTGEVNGVGGVGGLVGLNHNGIVENSFWDNETSGQTTSAGGTGKTTAEMKDVATFTELSTVGLDEPWDFLDDPNNDTEDEDIWHIHKSINDGYPFLTWEPSLIYDWYDLDAVRNSLDESYLLMNDIDESSNGYDVLVDTEEGFEPMGDLSDPFTGSFDGNGHEIRDLYVNRPDDRYVGLFGFVQDVTIENLEVTGSVTGKEWVGGLVGYSDIGETYINRTIANVDVTNPQTSIYDRVGGLVGILHSGNRIRNCATHGIVDGRADANIGGLIGRIHQADVIIENSYATGLVNGGDPGDDVGGLVGYTHADAEVIDSYWDMLSTGQDISAGGSPLETDDMTGGRATVAGAMEGFDFYDIWYITESYPELAIHYEINDHLNGQGTEADPYQIETLVGIQSMNYALHANFTLDADIDASETEVWYTDHGFDPIGDSSNFFTGAFNGNRKTISGLHINRPTEEFVGPFGYAVGSEIRDVDLIDVDVNGEQRVGGLVGYNDGLVSHSSVGGNVSGETWYTSGLIGYNYYNGEVIGSCSSGTVEGTNGVGGLIGLGFGTISDSYSTADVIATGNYIGGLVGEHRGETISSYSTGEVSGVNEVGGLIGWNSGTVEDSFWDNETSGQTTSAGGTGKTTEEMKSYETFTNTDTEGLDEPWDIDVIAASNIENDYPYLNWDAENSPVWYIEQTGYAVSFDVSVEDIKAGEQPIVEIYNAEDQFGGPLDGSYNVSIEIGDGSEVVTLSFEGGETSYEWEQITESDEYTVEVTIDGESGSDTFSVNPDDVDTVIISPVDGQTTVTAGEDLSFTAEASDEYDNLITDNLTGFGWEYAVDGVFNQELAGDYNVTATYDGVTSDSVMITVEPGDLNYVEISPQESTVTVGESETYTAVAYDEYGNEVGDVTDGTDWDIDEDAGGSWDANVYTSGNPGTWTVTGTYEGKTDETTLVVDLNETDFIPENLLLEVTPIEGEPPLEVTISVSGENVGDGDGSIDVIIATTIEYTLNLPAGESEEHEFTHTFDEVGTYLIEFHDLSETVVVGSELETYILTVNIVGEGSVHIDPDLDEFEEGTEVTLTATPDKGYEFVEWTGDESDIEDTLKFAMNEDKTITAVFEELQSEFQITDFVVEPTEGDAPLEVQITAELENVGEVEGTIMLVTSGLELDSWTLGPGDLVSVDESYTYNEEGLYYVDLGEETITVNVGDVETYTMTVNVDGDGIVEISPDRDMYEEGTVVTLTAVTSDGWEFVEWIGDYPSGMGEETTITLNMDSEKTLTASFIEKDDESTDVEEDPWFLDPMILGLMILAIVVILALIFFVMKRKSSGTPPGPAPDTTETPSPQPEGQQVDTYPSENQKISEEQEWGESQETEPDVEPEVEPDQEVEAEQTENADIDEETAEELPADREDIPE